MTRYTPDVEPIIREAGALLISYFQRRIGYEYKGDVDLVTEADRASEKFITERLQSRWPDFGILGEEGTRSDMAAEYRWLVDPLDGTTNFAHGYPVFCISIALTRGEELIAGFLYDPTRDEFFSAEHGAGAKLNGVAMRVSKTQTLSESLLGTGFPATSGTRILIFTSITSSPCARMDCGVPVRPRSTWRTSLAVAMTATGNSISTRGTRRRRVLVREAGGMVTSFDGSPFLLNSREVLASNGIIHDELMRNFAEIFAGRGLEELPSPVEYAKARRS